MCRRSQGEALVYFAFPRLQQRSRICRLTLFCCCSRLECASLQVLKITKQHEAAARKLWMRSRAASTARSDMKGDFVLDSPLLVSYLCSVVFCFFFFFLFFKTSFLSCTIQIAIVGRGKLHASVNTCHYPEQSAACTCKMVRIAEAGARCSWSGFLWRRKSA